VKSARLGWMLCVTLLTMPAAARAQIVPELETQIAKAHFDAGNYREALQRADAAMALSNFSPVQRIDLHRIAALASFNLGDVEGCDRHFLHLLQLDPDYVLDPFAAPPPALKRFEAVKRENAEALSIVRQQTALRLDQERRAAEALEQQRKLDEERRRRVETLAREAVGPSAAPHLFVVNLLPFGAGQFQQGRVGWGVFWAVAEGALAVASVASFWLHDALASPYSYRWTDRLTTDGTFGVTVRRIPPERQADAQALRWSANLTGLGFYLAWALGAGDALWHRSRSTVRPQLSANPTGAALTFDF
jgi:tetratricopeptide (TPR) repeat protein